MNVDVEAMERKAEQLPKNGVPPEIVRLLPHDTTLDKLMVQKNATPCDGARESVGAAARDMELRTPNAVMMEKSSVDEVDANLLRQGALEHVSGRSRAEHESECRGATTGVQEGALAREAQSFALRLASRWSSRCERPECPCGGDRDDRALARTSRMGDRAASVDLETVQFRLWEMMETDASRVRYVVYPGRQMMSQFVPWFFGVAFPFCFKYGVGMPDMPEWQENARHRRGPAAPRVELALWARIMTRRVESQFRREWRFGFTLSSVLFQSSVNMARSVRLADYRKDGQTECQYSQSELERAAVSIVDALYGTFKDPSTGKHANVRGDFSKLKYVQSLDPIARRLAAGASAGARKIEGRCARS